MVQLVHFMFCSLGFTSSRLFLFFPTLPRASVGTILISINGLQAFYIFYCLPILSSMPKRTGKMIFGKH
jgi:hypothetical protein